MSGTKVGGMKAAMTIKTRFGEGFYARIGKKGVKMNREIKLRAYSNAHKRYCESITLDALGEWAGWIDDGMAYLTVTDIILEQYTGLKDKNGKEIYEGDIVKFGCGDQTPAEVVYQEGSYFIKALDDGTLFYDPETNKPCPFGWFETYGLEVIGNIHENKELIGGGE